MFTFSLVRNLWDRMVSYYTWRKAQSFTHLAVTFAQSMGFSTFLNADQTRASVLQNPYASYINETVLFLRIGQLADDLQPL